MTSTVFGYLNAFKVVDLTFHTALTIDCVVQPRKKGTFGVELKQKTKDCVWL